MAQVIAVDWSGWAKGAAESIWLARVVAGRLVELDNGLGREAVVAALVDRGRREPRTVVGLDFSFSFPAWFCARQGWRNGQEVWAAVGERAEELLAAGAPPFWGRPGTVAQRLGDPFRQTEKDLERRPKSTFQIGGAGTVGTGSLRGMGHLARLAAAGFTIWPFDEAGWPRVVEVYPRLCVPAGVVKSRHRSRRDHLHDWFPQQDPVLLERAAGCEDAFDAAVTALAMAADLPSLIDLPRFTAGAPQLIEGCVWAPTTRRGAQRPAPR